MKWSKKHSTFAAAFILIALLFLSSCKAASPVGDVNADLSAVLSLSAGSSDFGLLEPETGEKNLPVNVSNEGTAAVTLSEIVLSDTDNFSSDNDGLPISIEPGESISINCFFHPAESGTFESTMSIYASGYTSPLEVILNGEGNYPPTVIPGIMVHDDEPEVAGFYVKDGVYNGRDLYRHVENTGYIMYYFESEPPGTVSIWVINQDGADRDNYIKAHCYSIDNPAPSSPALVQDWSIPATMVEDGIPSPVICGGNLSSCSTGDIIRASYIFHDTEGDIEGNSIFTWYRCSNPDDPGYAIPGAGGKNYSLVGDDGGKYLRVQIQAAAASGTQLGEPLISQTTIKIMFGM